LVWAAAGTSIMGNQEVELYLAMSVFPIFMLPIITRWALANALSLTRIPGLTHLPVTGAHKY
jgi:hypothetical protein